MKLAKKVKDSPRLSLLAYVEWPCGDITQHEILEELICQSSFKRFFWLATPYGPIYKSWADISCITDTIYRPRGWEDAPDWASGEGEC